MANIHKCLELSAVFKKLVPDFVFDLTFICVFGEKGNEVIFITKDDYVFAFGDNSYGRLGLGHKNVVKEPTKVHGLCGKQLVDICYGNEFMIALTKSGQCFSWGRNNYGMLGNGNEIDCNEPKLINALSNEVIVSISSGSHHSLVLTQKGEIYSFGYNGDGRVGIGNNWANQLIPIKVIGFDSLKIVSISSGTRHSLALTEKGKVFSWGHNSNGELGIGNYTNQFIPVKVSLKDDVLIKQISCCYDQTLLLSTDGDIYAFGYNKSGQLGNGNKINQNFAIKLNSEIKFKEIASHSLSNISIALSENGFCYVWGECDGEMITAPKETRIQLIDDCFLAYSKIKRTLHLTRLCTKTRTNKISETIAKSFNNPEKSDLKIKVEDKYIYVHKTVLILLCKHFKSMLSENWSESESNEIEITEHSYSTYYSFLKFVYTDSIDVKVEEAMDLLDLANSYFEEELKEKCIEVFKSGISIENCCTIYSLAVKYELQELENFCFNFASNIMNDIYKTESFKHMGKTFLVRFLTRYGDNKLFS